MSIIKQSAGSGYVVLNILRVLNIIVLSTVIVASWVMLVKTFVLSELFFLDAVSHVATSVVSMFLIISELPIFKPYFSHNWPLLGPTSGFVCLGVIMAVLGVTILGNLNKQAISLESLGLPFWRIVISSGILVITLGFMNIIANYVFRDKKAGVTARQVRSYGAVAATTRAAVGLDRCPRKPYINEFMHNRRSPSVTENRRQLDPKMPLDISAKLATTKGHRKNPETSILVAKPDNTYHPRNAENV
ncbi:hypothetical protein FGG08_001858 [Glutinoglossum americanum]|uniref:DUF7598 domain-containing protein n=1 Tax=Glutinoglossum americanum TaxID=1670608 RepID=A0A9P8L4X8_9PEZI|nr:hypothetical protein FGG08_001858 [Glutinoglossum americanum]